MSAALTPTQLVEVVRADRRRRWAAGHRVLAEAYLEQYPDLEANPTLAVELIYHEVLLREELGESFSLDEYLRRFPRLVPQLEPLFEVHRAIEAGGANASTPSLNRSLQHTPPHSERGDAPLPVVPGYDVLGRLGRGGMGVVYRARHQRLDRVVALKMLLTGTEAETGELDRFRAEAEAQAHLQHPNIVQIFEVGETNGCPYFALEYVEGGSLERKCRGTPQPPLTAARLVETVARAVHHAHQRGLVHRDLKPANILLTAEGAPKVSDFGLAKRLTGGAGESTEAGNSRSQDLVGTPSYMAPEQAAAQREMIGPAADVYALGAILYELLTGRPPFLAETALDTLLQVRSLDPVPVRRLQPQVARDLETVCLKCLRKEPAKRYATAEALADDLRRYQEGQPVAARPVGWWERGAKWAKRRPAVAALLLTLILIVGGSVAGLAALWQRAEKNLVRAKAAETRATAINNFLTKDLLAVDLMGEKGATLTLRQVVDTAAAKIEAKFADQPEVEASVRHAVGLIYLHLGEYTLAEAHLRKAADLFQSIFGLDHPETLEVMASVGEVLRHQDKFAEAESLCRRIAESYHRILGANHPDTLRALNDLALVFRDQGKPREAEPLFRQIVEASGGSLEPDHYVMRIALNNLGLTLLDQHRFKEAEAFLRRSLEARERVRGPNHPETLRALNNLGMALKEQNRLEEAEPLYRRSLEGRQRLLGPDHSETLDSMNNLAVLLRLQGKLDQAEPLLRHCLEVWIRQFGPEHQRTLVAKNNLGRVLNYQKKHGQAEPLFREAITGFRKVRPPGDLNLALCLSGLGDALVGQRRWADSEPVLREALESLLHRLPKEAPPVLQAQEMLAGALIELSRYAEAEPLLLGIQRAPAFQHSPPDQQRKFFDLRIIRLYDEWGKPEQAKEWRDKKDKLSTAAPAPKPKDPPSKINSPVP